MEQGGEKYLIEVKGCTLAGSELGFGLFPDAPTERGVKHLNELAEAAGQGYHCAIVFCDPDERYPPCRLQSCDTAGVPGSTGTRGEGRCARHLPELLRRGRSHMDQRNSRRYSEV